MEKIKLTSSCPCCGSTNYTTLGIQPGVSFDLILANCENEKCEAYKSTFSTYKIIKTKKEEAA